MTGWATFQKGEFCILETVNSQHAGFFVEIRESHIPRVFLALSKKFIHQSEDKQCFDHIFSIDLDKIIKVDKVQL